jgi:hypothetical protein
MDEEKKTYDFTGTVTISTEEYRDLIERAIRSELEAEKSRSDWFKEYNRADLAEKKFADTSKGFKELAEFIKSDEDTYAMYMAWKAERGENDGI